MRGTSELSEAAPGFRAARSDDVPRLADALAAAFHDDPVFEWLLPVERRRRTALRRFFELELRTVGLARGTVWTTDDLSGAAITTPPGKWRLPWPIALLHTPGFLRAFGARLPYATGLLQRMEGRHLRESHHYFAYIGVVPELQGRGLGTSLMRPTLDLCDEARLPAYLEATCERNAVLYERLGFAVVDTLTFAGSPPLRLMVRRPSR